MDSFSVCVTFISVLLGIAYPILIQITSNDKYSSEQILDLFENNWCRKYFIPNLIVALLFIGIYLLKLEPVFIFKNKILFFLISNSACIIIFVLTISLIINFFLITKLVTTFYRTSALIKFLDSKSKKVLDGTDFSSFDGMADLLYWSIQNQDSNASKQLSVYFHKIFQNYRENFTTKDGIVYPDRFYWLTYNASEKIVGMNRNNLIFLENRTIGGIWLLGEFNVPKISDNTYGWLWANLALSLNSGRGDLIMTLWHTTHQYFTFNLQAISPDYDFQNDGLIFKNQSDIDNRNQEREAFLEFHYALGGLLLYKGRHDLIQRIFNYTTSTPPDYVLLPKHMTQIFNMFFKFFDPYHRNFPWITHKYNFPGLEGLNADNTIKDWVCQYIAILFIRQFNLMSFYVNWNPLEMPRLPQELSEKRFWAENIKYFKPILEKTIDTNQGLFKDLVFSTDKGKYMAEFEKIEKYIIDDFNTSQVDVIPEKSKIDQFMDASAKILLPTFELFDKLSNKNDIAEIDEKLTFNIQGIVNITSKGDFVEDGVTHLNFDSFLAESVRNKYSDDFFKIFNTLAKKKFIFDQENVFNAIDNLELDFNKHLIIAFGFINIDYYIDNLKIQGLQKENYKKVPLYFFPGRIYGVSNSLFILSKSSLPKIEYKEFDQKTIDLYEIKPIIKSFNTYAGVSDLNTNNELRKLIEKEPADIDKDLHKSVWQGIIFQTLIKWPTNFNMIQILIKNEFENQKRKNDLDDISSSDIK